MQIHLKNVKLAFPQLWEPKQVNGQGEPAYSATLLINADDPQVDAVNAIIDKVADARWGVKAKAVLATLRGADKVALHDGDTKAEYAGFEGTYFISARSKVAPLVVNADRTPLLANSGRPYAGCYVNAIVEIWGQDNQFGKRVNASLKGIQFWRDGEAFAGTPPASTDDFDDCSSVGDDGADLL